MKDEWLRVERARHGRSDVARDGANVIEPPERIPWVRPILDPDGSLLADIHAALSTGRVTNDGPNLREFERRLAGYPGVVDCVAVSSGSAALFLAVGALDLRGGTAVLPSFTFRAGHLDDEPGPSRSLVGRRSTDPPRRPGERVRVHPDLGAMRRAIDSRGAVLVLDNAHGFGTEQAGAPCPREPTERDSAVVAVAARAVGGELAGIPYEKGPRYGRRARVGWRIPLTDAVESLAVTGARPRFGSWRSCWEWADWWLAAGRWRAPR